jgi:hypothetical protein
MKKKKTKTKTMRKRSSNIIHVHAVRVEISESENALLQRWAKQNRVSVNSLVRSLIRNAAEILQ